MGETTWAYYERLHRESCLREEQLKQQLEEKDKEIKYHKEWALDFQEQLKEAVEVIEELNDIVVGHIEEGDKLDSFTLQLAKQFLAKYRGENE